MAFTEFHGWLGIVPANSISSFPVWVKEHNVRLHTRFEFGAQYLLSGWQPHFEALFVFLDRFGILRVVKPRGTVKLGTTEMKGGTGRE